MTDILQPRVWLGKEPELDIPELLPPFDPATPEGRSILDRAEREQREQAEREVQAEFDDRERRLQAARDKIRREKEEADLSGGLTGDAEVFYELKLKPRLTEIHAYEQKVRTPIVQGLLFRDSLAWLAGASGTFKSFIAADLAFRYAAEDMDYHGRRMTSGRALLVVAEGAAGYADRRVAWEQEHGREIKDVVIYPAPLQLADVQKEMPALLCHLKEEEEAGHGYGLIIFDTQAMCTVGVDENTSEMNLVVNVLHRIREASGACVLTVHHFGKNEGKGMRGSSMIYAAADTVIVVDRESGALAVTLSTGGEHGKQKDTVTERDFLTLRMRTRKVGRDFFGDPVDSLVPYPDGPSVHDVIAEDLPDVFGLDMFYLKALGTFEEDGAKPAAIRARILEADEDEADEYHDWLRIPDGHNVKPQTPSNRLQRLKSKGLADKKTPSGDIYVITPRGHQVVAREVINRERVEESWTRPRRYSRSAPGGQAELPDETANQGPDLRE